MSAAASDDAGSHGRQRIRRLDEAVVNRIAAGEIIQRPCNAIKEMMENSLDAGATSINILVKSGGLKSLQIRDNGCGINLADLPIVCERFTTSKLTTFEDLRSIQTFGFRGEALASISHVAHVTITTKTKDSKCAYKARYGDGKLVPLQPGHSSDPKPCAGNQGTQILVEDLFYNVSTRRKALSNANEEHNKLVAVVSDYAVHNAGVAISLKKQGASKSDVSTSIGATKIDNIRTLHGSGVANELLEVKHENDSLKFTVDGYVSNANYSMKRFTLLLFINQRRVSSTSIKRGLQEVYSKYLPKGTHPFVYLSLRMAPENIDVNVHPTKQEVHFLHEGAIVAEIQEMVQEKLLGANSSRTFKTQTLLPGAAPPKAPKRVRQERVGASASDADDEAMDDGADAPATKSKSASQPRSRSRSKGDGPRVYDHELIRTDSRAQKLDAFLVKSSGPSTPAVPSASKSNGKGKARAREPVEVEEDDWDPIRNRKVKRKRLVAPDEGEGAMDDGADSAEVQSLAAPAPSKSAPKPAPAKPAPASSEVSIKAKVHWPMSNVALQSVQELRQGMIDQEHKILKDLFNKHKFVGCVDRSCALLQYQTKLYLIKTRVVWYLDLGRPSHMTSREFFSQLVFRGFSHFPLITLDPAVPLHPLLVRALDREESGWTPEDGAKDELAQHMVTFLESKSPMTAEYFGMEFKDGHLHSLPLLLDKHIPKMSGLPMFLFRMATEVEWDVEKDCFQTLSKEVGLLYQDFENPVGNSSWEWFTEHVIFASMRTMFSPPVAMAEDLTVSEAADLHNLYKVFERC